MGEVFLAHDERLDRQVAIKRLRGSGDLPAERRERFRREARIAARLKHPAIVQIHDVLRDGDLDCIVMEYVEGEDLRRRIEAGPLSLHETLSIGRQIALAMAEAHDQGIIHRDLKSENVLITQSRQVKITDFGIAKDLRDEALTADGYVLGTYRAMSPEQALGRALDHRSDLFSFGILLYEALTGTSPFHGETTFVTLHRVVFENPPPIRPLLPHLPAALIALIEQLLQKDPLLRPRDFHEVAETLAEIQGDVAGKPCSGSTTGLRSQLDSDGDTPATVDPTPAPARGNALSAARNDLAGARIPDATPATRPETSAVLAIAMTEPQTPAMQVAPAAPTPALSARPGDDAVSVVAPRAALTRPRQRGRRAAALTVAAAALALALGYWFTRQSSTTGDEITATRPGARIRVAVPRPRIDAPAELPQGHMLAAAVRAALVRGLLGMEGVAALPLDDIDIVTEGFERERGRQPLQRELMHAVGANELCSARLECTQQGCRVSLERLASDGTTHATVAFEVATEDIRGSDRAVFVHLSELYPDHRVVGPGTSLEMDPADYADLLRLREAYWQDAQTMPVDEILDRLDAIRARTKGAIEVHRFEAEVLQHRYVQTADVRYLARALEVIRAAEAQAPDSHALLLSRFELALKAGERQEAEEVLRRIEARDPGSSTTARLRGQWHNAIGEHEQALSFLRRAAASDSSWRSLYALASVEDDLGMLDEAQAHLDQLLERSPGNYAALSLRANIEMEHGNPACALALYRELVARRPYYQECIYLGITEMMVDGYQDAARSFRCALAVRPDDTRASFNLAESLKLAGDSEAATREFRRLLETLQRQGGRTSDSRMLEVQVLAHLAGDEPALADQTRALLQTMLAETPPSAPQRTRVLYRAAVVHALLGEHDRASEHVRTLLDQGYTSEWFRFPWFDGVRREPALHQRLSQTPPARTCTQDLRQPRAR